MIVRLKFGEIKRGVREMISAKEQNILNKDKSYPFGKLGIYKDEHKALPPKAAKAQEVYGIKKTMALDFGRLWEPKINSMIALACFDSPITDCMDHI